MLLGTPAPAHAYVGPGAAIGFMGAALGLVVAVVAAVGVVLTWPLRRLRRRAKQNRAAVLGQAGASGAEPRSG